MSVLKFRLTVTEALLQSSPLLSATPKHGRSSLQSITGEQTPPTSSGVTPNPPPTTNIRIDKFDH